MVRNLILKISSAIESERIMVYATSVQGSSYDS